MRKIDDIEYTVEISCYFLTKWHEDRLVLHEDILKEKYEDEIEEDEEQWYPIDLEFVSKVCSWYGMVYGSRDKIGVCLHRDGFVHKISRCTL